MRFSHIFRYSCRHSHSTALQRRFRVAFSVPWTLPYLDGRPEGRLPIAASEPGFSPVPFSAPPRLTSELLRTL